MATKQEMVDELIESGQLAEDADPDDYTGDQLKAMLSGGSSDGATVADTIDATPGLDAGNVAESPVVQSTTEVVPRDGDETSMPNALETEPAAPVSTQQPDEPIAQTLAAGAGEHTPPDPEKFDNEGRPKG